MNKKIRKIFLKACDDLDSMEQDFHDENPDDDDLREAEIIVFACRSRLEDLINQ